MPGPQDRSEPADPTGQNVSPGRLREYQLGRRLATGELGAVYQARHLRLERTFALRTLSPCCAGNAQALQRFQCEMRAVDLLDHPSIVRATDGGEVDGVHFLVTELVEGVDLLRLMRRAGPLSIAAACEVVCQVAATLQHLDEHGLVHRNIKPSNLMVGPNGQVKVLDLGLGAFRAPGCGAGALAVGGDRGIGYAAPEWFTHRDSVDIRSDIYSLGCTLFFMLAGGGPVSPAAWPPDDPRPACCAPQPKLAAWPWDAPRSIDQAIQRMMAALPCQRLQSPQAVAECLGRFAAGGQSHLASLASIDRPHAHENLHNNLHDQRVVDAADDTEPVAWYADTTRYANDEAQPSDPCAPRLAGLPAVSGSLSRPAAVEHPVLITVSAKRARPSHWKQALFWGSVCLGIAAAMALIIQLAGLRSSSPPASQPPANTTGLGGGVGRQPRRPGKAVGRPCGDWTTAAESIVSRPGPPAAPQLAADRLSWQRPT